MVEEGVSGDLPSPLMTEVEGLGEGSLSPRASSLLATGLTGVLCADPY